MFSAIFSLLIISFAVPFTFLRYSHFTMFCFHLKLKNSCQDQYEVLPFAFLEGFEVSTLTVRALCHCEMTLGRHRFQ